MLYVICYIYVILEKWFPLKGERAQPLKKNQVFRKKEEMETEQ